MPHSWLVAPSRADQRRGIEAAAGDAVLIDAHRNHRGPYTAAGALIGLLFERFPEAARQAAANRMVTLLAVKPELSRLIDVPVEVARSLEIGREGRLRSWSLRSAHAIADFVQSCLARAESPPFRIAFISVDQADPLDQEWLGVMLRRADPARLRLLIATTCDKAPEALAELGEPLRVAHELPDRWATAEAYVADNCTDDDPRTLETYAALEEGERLVLHRRQVERLNEPAFALGAIPLHRERIGEDASTLAAAARRCMYFAYYEASLDWGRRAVALAEKLGDEPTRNAALRDVIFALLMLDRFDEAEALSERCLNEISDPGLHVHANYTLAILAIRFRPNRDLVRGRHFVDRATEAARQLAPSDSRTATLGFLRNTLALTIFREGDQDAAMRLVTEAIEEVARDAPDAFPEEAMILYHNRARLHRAAGRDDEALADLDRLLELVPSAAAARFDRALLHQQKGRSSEAIRDYDAALKWAPPHVPTLVNRAQLLGEAGMSEAAMRDYDHALEIEPDHAEALFGRARLRWQLAGLAEASADVARGLALKPNDARLHCLNGLIALTRRHLGEAEAAFDRAIECDPALADGWANRATVRWKLGALDDALGDLDHALALREDPAIRRNREKVLAALARRPSSLAGEASSHRVGLVPPPPP